MKLPLWLQALKSNNPVLPDESDSCLSPGLQVRLYELKDKTAKDIMVPRALVAALDADVQLRRVKRLKSSKQQFFPVYKGDLDHILGWIPKAKVLDLLNDPAEDSKLAFHVQPAGYIEETVSVADLADFFLKSGGPFLVVRSPDGLTSGIVMLADFVDLIFGLEVGPAVSANSIELPAPLLRNYEL